MPDLSRRTLFLGGAAVAAGGAVLMNKPHDHSGPRDPISERAGCPDRRRHRLADTGDRQEAPFG
jgi:hypothetical protein